MLRRKRSYITFLLVLILGTLFSLAFSYESNSFQNRDQCITVVQTKPGFNGGVGWVVGSSDNNYGTILHPTDGGKHWVRQGSSDEIPNADFVSVIALDAWYAWVAGGKADGYGVILRTIDGGRSWIRQGENHGIIYHTTDGGSAWQVQDPVVDTALWGVSFVRFGYCNPYR